jgi:hypothetical protein
MDRLLDEIIRLMGVGIETTAHVRVDIIACDDISRPPRVLQI